MGTPETNQVAIPELGGGASVPRAMATWGLPVQYQGFLGRKEWGLQNLSRTDGLGILSSPGTLWQAPESSGAGFERWLCHPLAEWA